MNLLSVIFVAVTVLAGIPSKADAHLVTTGLGPFYDGAMHLLLSPVDLLGLVASSLLDGLNGDRAVSFTDISLPITWFTAGLVGLKLPVTIVLPWLSVLSFVILGILVAIDPKLPPAAVASLAGLFGFLHGLLNGSALGEIGAGPLSLFGIATTVLIISLLLAACIASLRTA